MTGTFKEGTKSIAYLNEKVLQSLHDRGMIASYLLIPLTNLSKRENRSQFFLVKDSNSNRVNIPRETETYQLHFIATC